MCTSGFYPMGHSWVFFTSKPGHREVEMWETVVEQESFSDSDCLRAVVISGERDLVSKIGVDMGMSFGGNEVVAYWSNLVAPLKPVLTQLCFLLVKGGLFSSKSSMSVNVS